MVDVTTAGSEINAARSRRQTWLVGGSLLFASALISLALGAAMMPTWTQAGDALFAAATAVFAIGIGREGSVTARRPLGTVALIGWGVWVLAGPYLPQLVPLPDTAMPAMGDLVALQVVSATVHVVTLALGIIAVSQIGRARVVPAPWQWAPLWALLVAIFGRLLVTAMLFAPFIDPTLMYGVSLADDLLRAGATGALGVLAIVLASHTERGATTAVYSSSNGDLSR